VSAPDHQVGLTVPKSRKSGSLASADTGIERETLSLRRRRQSRPRQLDAGLFAADVASFRLHLAAENKAEGTIRIYTEAPLWFAAASLLRETEKSRWEQVDAQDVQRWVAWLLGGYSEIKVRGKGGKDRTVKIDHEAARRVDRYLRVRARHEQAHRLGLWLGTGGRGPLTANGICQMVRRRGEQAGVDVWPHRFRHHFSHTWLDRGGAEGDLMELNGWSSPQMLQRYGGSARGARARRHYDLIMRD
jgi:integrase